MDVTNPLYRPDKPFHKAECRCQGCDAWRLQTFVVENARLKSERDEIAATTSTKIVNLRSEIARLGRELAEKETAIQVANGCIEAARNNADAKDQQTDELREAIIADLQNRNIAIERPHDDHPVTYQRLMAVLTNTQPDTTEKHCE